MRPKPLPTDHPFEQFEVFGPAFRGLKLRIRPRQGRFCLIHFLDCVLLCLCVLSLGLSVRLCYGMVYDLLLWYCLFKLTFYSVETANRPTIWELICDITFSGIKCHVLLIRWLMLFYGFFPFSYRIQSRWYSVKQVEPCQKYSLESHGEAGLQSLCQGRSAP